jgi:hypothetical protein
MLVAYFPRSNELLRAKLQTALQRPNSRFSLPSLRQGPITSLDTNESIREHVAQLIALGVSQTTLAKRMQLHPSWFNRWINKKGPPRVIPVTALDGFAAYLDELSGAIQQADLTTNEAHAPRRRDADALPARGATVKPRSGRKR